MTDDRAPASAGDGPLADLRVIDVATVIAGPGCARYLATSGPTSSRSSGPAWATPPATSGGATRRTDSTLWWKLAGRNKRTIALDLKDPDDLDDDASRCATRADVLVENFRPGTLERLGLGPDVLHARNPGLVVTRVTGFGQTGPYRDRPAFATQAEALSGFAAINGEPDGAAAAAAHRAHRRGGGAGRRRSRRWSRCTRASVRSSTST